jgi:hypothetical protein
MAIQMMISKKLKLKIKSKNSFHRTRKLVKEFQIIGSMKLLGGDLKEMIARIEVMFLMATQRIS